MICPASPHPAHQPWPGSPSAGVHRRRGSMAAGGSPGKNAPMAIRADRRDSAPPRSGRCGSGCASAAPPHRHRPAHRRQDGAMLMQRVPHAIGHQQQPSHHHAGAVGQRLQAGREDGIARRLQHALAEPTVITAVARPFRVLDQRLRWSAENSTRSSQDFRRQVLGGEPGAKPLQHLADIEDLQQLGRGGTADDRSPVRLPLDEAGLFQGGQDFADRARETPNCSARLCSRRREPGGI